MAYDNTPRPMEAFPYLLMLIGTLIFSWRGYNFWKNNSGELFWNDLLDGVVITLGAGYDHPAFGLCCILPILLSSMYILARFLDNDDGTVV